MRFASILTLLFTVTVVCPAWTSEAKAQIPSTDDLEVGIVEKLGQYVPLNLGFIGADSDSVYLRDVIDKPTVLTLVYYHCPHICLPLLSGVADVVAKTDLEPGKDYTLLTVSFDPVDNPQTASNMRTNVTKPLEKKLAPNAWRFLSGDSASIAGLLGATGFRVKKTDKDFAHGAALIILAPDGKIVRYLYGLSYLPFDLKMSVIEASKGRVGPSVARVLNFCFSYDPEGRRYVFNMTRVVGAVVLFGAVVFVTSLVVLERRKRKA